MKTQVIQLDVHDDVVSVGDKITWAKTPRILLVFPHHGQALARTLDLLLLKRHAHALGAQLGIVSTAAEARRAAKELGIPVFASTLQAQHDEWTGQPRRPRPRRRRARLDYRSLLAENRPKEASWTTQPVVRLVAFTLGVLAILAVVSLFIPSATITLSPLIQSQSVTLDISASPDISSVNMAGSLPAHSTSVVVQGSQTIPVTTTALVADEHARGKARFRNLTDSVIGIPAGTIIRTLTDPPVRFVTQQDAVVEAGSGRTIDISIQARDPGTGGNLPADTLIAIEGVLGANLAATNPEPTGGGTDRRAIVPSDIDRRRLRVSLLNELRTQAVETLSQSLGKNSILFPDTLQAVETLSETYQPEAGQPGNRLTLTLRVEFQTQYASEADMLAIETAALDANLPAGFDPLPDTLSVTRYGSPSTDSTGVTRWRVLAERSLRARIDSLTVARLILGQPVGTARQHLKSLSIRQSPIIQLTPAWWPWLPIIEFRIHTIFQ